MCDLADKYFKVAALKNFSEPRENSANSMKSWKKKKPHEQNEIFTKDKEIKKKNAAEILRLKNLMSKMKNAIDHLQESKVCGGQNKWWEDGHSETTQFGEDKEKRMKSEGSQSEQQDSIKRTNAGVPGVSEGERKGSRKLFKEIIAESFPNLGRELNIQVHKAITLLSQCKKNLLEIKDKEWILKADGVCREGGNIVNFKGIPLGSPEILHFSLTGQENLSPEE